MKQLFNISAVILCLLMTAAAFACSKSDENGTDSPSADFTLTKTALDFSRVASSANISANTSNITASSDADWCTVTVKEYSSVTKATPITIAVKENTEYNDRTATITVSNGNAKKNITVTQTSADGLIITKSSYSLSADGGTIAVDLKTNGNFTFSTSAEWITDVKSRASLRDESLTFSIARNAGGARTGTITFSLNDINETVTISQEGLDMGSITAKAKEIAKGMYPGINLGNTLEASGNSLAAETAWQGTKTSQAIIDYFASLGFKSIRIPCDWYMHMDGNHNIDAAWMARVTEVVNYCIADGLYVFLNDHWDNNWLENSMSSYDEGKAAILTTMWNQIANNFKDYGDHLIFGGLNEPAADNQSKTDNLVKYEQTFINAVRATGGNNSTRTLVVQGPSTDIDNTNKFYKTLPKDNVEGCLMVEVHFYSPWNFCGMESDADWGKMSYFWGANNHVSGSDRNSTWGEESYLINQFKKMKTQFVDKGYPVILGEYSCMWRKLPDHQAEHDASVKLFHKYVNKYAGDYGMVPMVWDVNYCNQNGTKGTMTLLNRANLSVFNTHAMEGIKEGVKEAKWPY